MRIIELEHKILINQNKEEAVTVLLIQKTKNENSFYKVFPPANVESDDNSRLIIYSDLIQSEKNFLAENRMKMAPTHNFHPISRPAIFSYYSAISNLN